MFDLLTQLLGAECNPVLQYMRPDSDVSASTWQKYGAATYWQCIDDEADGDGDLTFVWNTGGIGQLRVGLSDPTPAGVYVDPADPHTVRVRARYAGSLASGSAYLYMWLMQGATTIANTSHTLTPDYAQYEMTLTAEQKANITDYNSLEIIMEVVASPGVGYQARITQAYVLIGVGYSYPVWDEFTVGTNTDLASYTGPQGQVYNLSAGFITVYEATDRAQRSGGGGYVYGFQSAGGLAPAVGDEFICELYRNGGGLTGAGIISSYVFMAEGGASDDHIRINFTADQTSTVLLKGQCYLQGTGLKNQQTFNATLALADGQGIRVIAVLKSISLGVSMTFDIYTEPVGGGTRTLQYADWVVTEDYVTDGIHKYLGVYCNRVSGETHGWDTLGVRRPV